MQMYKRDFLHKDVYMNTYCNFLTLRFNADAVRSDTYVAALQRNLLLYSR